MQGEYVHNFAAHQKVLTELRAERQLHTDWQAVEMEFNDSMYLAGEINRAEWLLAKERIAKDGRKGNG